MKKYAFAPGLLLKWLSNEKKFLYKIYLLALLQGLVYAVIPLCIQGIVTYTMAGKFTASLILLGIATIAALLFIGLLQLMQMRINESIQQKIFGKLTDRLSSYLNSNPNSNLNSKIAQFFEVITLQKGIDKILLELSFSVVSIVFGLMILPAYSSWFLLFTILLALSFYFIVTYYGRRAIESNIRTSSEKYRLFFWFKTLSENTDLVKRDDYSSDNILNEYLTSRKEYYRTVEAQYIGVLAFKIFFVSLLLFLGAYLVQIGELNIGQFVASEIIILLVINGVEKLVASLGTCYDIITALYKIEDIFKDKPEFSFLNTDYKPRLNSLRNIYHFRYSKAAKWIFYSFLIVVFVAMIMPWTQNVEANGYVTALNPEKKPQNITSRIPGRIEKWYINDGDLVKKNDTIAFISEIKEDYVDPQLIERSESQIKSKETSLESYEKKINSIHQQIDALNKSLALKTAQIKNKITQYRAKLNTDSVEIVAAQNNLKVSEEQFKRFEELLGKGIISKTEFENRKVKLQESMAKFISSENKLINSKNELLNLEIELNSIQQEYAEKLMKAESDKYSSISLLYDAEGSLSKMQNQLSNYSLRKNYYYVLAPQDGYINKISVQGIGEIIKEGGTLCRITPLQDQQAVELFVDPIDIALISKGSNIQLIFDGWPSFFFSGWPGVSYGTYSAEIIAFDKVISENGKFRILALDKKKEWPRSLQIGGGVQGFAMLNNVPLIYELWRKVNGFPPDFYKNNRNSTDENKK